MLGATSSDDPPTAGGSSPSRRSPHRSVRRRPDGVWVGVWVAVVGVLVAIVGVVAVIAVDQGWLRSGQPSLEPTALTWNHLSGVFGSRHWAGGQLVVLNNLGGPARTILWISTPQRPEVSSLVTAGQIGARKIPHSQKQIDEAVKAAEVPANTGGEYVVSFWSLETCESGAVPITQDRPYVLLVDPRVSSPGTLVVPVYMSDVRYHIHLNDGSVIDVAPSQIPQGSESYFEPTAELILHKCAGTEMKKVG
jgi:hypothetical protein